MLIEKEDYAMRVGAYIERNAKRLGLVNDPGDWKCRVIDFMLMASQSEFH